MGSSYFGISSLIGIGLLLVCCILIRWGLGADQAKLWDRFVAVTLAPVDPPTPPWYRWSVPKKVVWILACIALFFGGILGLGWSGLP